MSAVAKPAATPVAKPAATPVAKPASAPAAKPASTPITDSNAVVTRIRSGKEARRAQPDKDETCVENKWVETTQRYVRTQNISEYLNHLSEILNSK